MASAARTKDDIITALKQRILTNNPGLDDVDPHADLVDEGLINSLQFISFLMLIEELREREVPEEDVEIDRFRSLATIYANFFDGPRPAEAT
jgi:acyl carrier protein